VSPTYPFLDRTQRTGHQTVIRAILVLVSGLCTACFSHAWLGEGKPDRTQKTLVVGHRGLGMAKHAPENTLSNMRACLELRIGIELDVRRSKDGQLVVIHDATLDRTTNGKGKVSDFTLAELKKLDAGSWFDPSFKDERIPTLEEVFALRAKHPPAAGIIAVDLKEADTEEDIVHLAQKHGVLNQLVFIGRAINEPEVRQRLRKADAKTHVAYLARAADAIDAAVKDSNADWIYIRFLPSLTDVGRVHAAGKRFFLSGPKVAGVEIDTWKLAIDLGIDAILTDHPLELGKLMRAGTADETAKPIRVASEVSGHIHPAACVTKSGTLLVIYSKSDFKDLRLSRSIDGGKTWSEPVAVPHTEKLSIYPGSLTALRDGRIIHAWNTWYADDKAKDGKSRFPQFSISNDDGKTWSEPKSLPKNPEAPSIIRHPIVELSPNEWLFSLSDKTVVYDPRSEKLTPLGDGHQHGLVPLVRTPKGTFASGSGLRSADQGKTWQKIAPFPQIGADGWRFDMIALENGWLLASEVVGPGFGGDRWRFVASRDDGQSWDFDAAVDFYNPGRPIGGRGCPRTVQVDKETLGTVFYDTDPKQAGGPGVFFMRTPLTRLQPRGR
jgi:glycerophosphoryl diester phosphodiesterase